MKYVSKRCVSKRHGAYRKGRKGFAGFSKAGSKSLRTKTYGSRNKIFQRGGNCRTIANPQANNVFPDRVFATLRYCEQHTLYTDNATGLIGATQTYNLNSLHDPDQTSLGHQPGGYDQLIAIYNRWAVYAVRATISILNCDAATGALCMKWQPINNANSWTLAGRTAQNCRETNNCTVLDCPSASPVQQWQSDWIHIADMNGATRTQIFSDAYWQGTSSSNPSFVPQLVIGAGSYALETNKKIQFQITLEYKAVFMNRNELEQS